MTARSWVQILPVAAVYQCQLSVPFPWCQLTTTSESWGVNGQWAYHAMHWPRIRGLAALASVWLRANETELSGAACALEPQEKTTFYCIAHNYESPYALVL